MRLFFCLVSFLVSGSALAAVPQSFPRAHNFLLTSAGSLEEWLIPIPRWHRASLRTNLLFSRQPDVWDLYQDVKSKDSGRISRRLDSSYGVLYDAAAKVFVEGRIGSFSQSFSMNAAASLLVNDPVFPELAGILYNNFALRSAYDFAWSSVRWRPSLVYGVRRVMEQRFTVGQLVSERPNTKLKTYPYYAFAEAGLDASYLSPWGEVFLNAKGIPVYGNNYSYWQADLGYRSPNILGRVKRDWPWRWDIWASFAPFYGGSYTLGRTLRVGTTAEWFKYAQTDLFFMDNFRPGIVLRLGTSRWNAQLFTFARMEDEFGQFVSRQYGLALSGAF